MLRPLRAVPAVAAVLALRLACAALWLPAWACALGSGRAPRWWRRLAAVLLARAARARAYAWMVVDAPPRAPLARALVPVVAPAPARLPRRSLLARPLLLPWFGVLRYVAGAFALVLGVAAWLAAVVVRRRPAGVRRAQRRLQAFATDADAYWLLLASGRPRLPEPDPRLRRGGRPGRGFAALPPWPRRTGWIAIGIDFVGSIIVLTTFASFAEAVGSVDAPSPPVALIGDLGIQLVTPYVGFYLAAQIAPVTVAQFGLHVLAPLRSFGWALVLVGAYAVVLAALALPFGFVLDDGGGIVPDGAGTAWTIVFVAMATVVAPVLEEIFYRGLVFQALRGRGRRGGRSGTWRAATISSIAFAAAHFEFAPLALADRALIGIGLCWLLARTGRLLPGMFAHSMNNAVVLPLALGWDWQIAIVLPASLGVIALVAALVSRARGEWDPMAEHRHPAVPESGTPG